MEVEEALGVGGEVEENLDGGAVKGLGGRFCNVVSCGGIAIKAMASDFSTQVGTRNSELDN